MARFESSSAQLLLNEKQQRYKRGRNGEIVLWLNGSFSVKRRAPWLKFMKLCVENGKNDDTRYDTSTANICHKK
jgi:hypothetical protein